MDDINIVSAIEWHDAVLLETKVTVKKHMAVILVVEVYELASSRVRKKIKIQFMMVENLTLLLDGNELSEHKRAGNISNGYVKQYENKYKFFLYLSSGIISLNFQELSLTKI